MKDTMFRYAELRKLPEGEDRTVEFVISNEKRDRHGTILRASGWKLDNYKKNPVVGYAHALHGSMFGEVNPDSIIGKGEVFVEGRELIGRVTFEPAELNPLAEKIFQKVKFGSLRTASVGFVPTGEPEYGKGDEARGKENETMYFPGQELLEWSIVNIPSNPSAAKRAFADDLDEFFENAAKALNEKVQKEDLRKMTIEGIVKLLKGESVEKDKEENEDSQRMQVERDLQRIRLDLAYLNDFDNLLEIEKQKKEKERQDDLKAFRLNIHILQK